MNMHLWERALIMQKILVEGWENKETQRIKPTWLMCNIYQALVLDFCEIIKRHGLFPVFSKSCKEGQLKNAFLSTETLGHNDLFKTLSDYDGFSTRCKEELKIMRSKPLPSSLNVLYPVTNYQLLWFQEGLTDAKSEMLRSAGTFVAPKHKSQKAYGNLFNEIDDDDNDETNYVPMSHINDFLPSHTVSVDLGDHSSPFVLGLSNEVNAAKIYEPMTKAADEPDMRGYDAMLQKVMSSTKYLNPSDGVVVYKQDVTTLEEADEEEQAESTEDKTPKKRKRKAAKKGASAAKTPKKKAKGRAGQLMGGHDNPDSPLLGAVALGAITATATARTRSTLNVPSGDIMNKFQQGVASLNVLLQRLQQDVKKAGERITNGTVQEEWTLIDAEDDANAEVVPYDGEVIQILRPVPRMLGLGSQSEWTNVTFHRVDSDGWHIGNYSPVDPPRKWKRHNMYATLESYRCELDEACTGVNTGLSALGANTLELIATKDVQAKRAATNDATTATTATPVHKETIQDYFDTHKGLGRVHPSVTLADIEAAFCLEPSNKTDSDNVASGAIAVSIPADWAKLLHAALHSATAPENDDVKRLVACVKEWETDGWKTNFHHMKSPQETSTLLFMDKTFEGWVVHEYLRGDDDISGTTDRMRAFLSLILQRQLTCLFSLPRPGRRQRM